MYFTYSLCYVFVHYKYYANVVYFAYYKYTNILNSIQVEFVQFSMNVFYIVCEVFHKRLFVENRESD